MHLLGLHKAPYSETAPPPMRIWSSSASLSLPFSQTNVLKMCLPPRIACGGFFIGTSHLLGEAHG